ncbi:RebB family R body protein (plasmid) [Eleftheria terrae]|nr:RebB family R body protein [Eleftheria terrae]WKB55753.1 RebB family R body protein [Eleftheria terrae]
MVGPPDTCALATIGQAPAWAMASTYVAMADSIGLAMENAAANQQRGQVLAAAAVAQVLAMILQKGASP